MEDLERYSDYTEFEDDLPKGKNPVVLALKIIIAVVCFGVIGLLGFRIIIFNHYPDSIKEIYFNESLVEYFNAHDGDVEILTQKISAPYDDPDVSNFFCDNLIVVRDAGSLQLSVRYNLALVSTLKEKYGVDIDPTSSTSFTYRLVRNPELSGGEAYEIGKLAHAFTEEGMMYSYTKLVFDDVDFGMDEGEEPVKWIRLEIDIAGVTLEEPFAMICIYENNERYDSFSHYKLSEKEIPNGN